MSVQPARFAVEREDRAEGSALRLLGELDLASVPNAERHVEDVLAEGRRPLVLDLRELTFVDSSGLRFFILLADRAREQGWELKLLPPPEPAMTVFRLTGAVENLPFVEGEA
jgi:anti-anti-sigma factor